MLAEIEQVFTTYKGHAIEVLDDSHALRLSRGDILIVRSELGFRGDGLHVLRSTEVVRLQQLPRGEVRLVRGDGGEEIMMRSEIEASAIGFVTKTVRPA
ncbi:hypothetical protein SAMN05421853_1106 [Roseivivax halotolerans]|uniref:Peptidase S24/S26A/S26B/S26C domain-containing protein n=1 Tax=Roseivivax halotolerans TaxID=93684 RepID=A0A1I5ZHK9_9RHOB|nr:hypothetical protein [Roseivivax halotolerans]SFQ55617.1 hypothetical protein SAMN05421853_1106 [Roseivivax halotolerans]